MIFNRNSTEYFGANRRWNTSVKVSPGRSAPWRACCAEDERGSRAAGRACVRQLKGQHSFKKRATTPQKLVYVIATTITSITMPGASSGRSYVTSLLLITKPGGLLSRGP